MNKAGKRSANFSLMKMRMPVTPRTFYADYCRMRLPQVQRAPLEIAWGNSLGCKPVELRILHLSGLPSVRVIATDPARDWWAQIWPAFSRRLLHNGECFEMWAAVSNADVRAAQALLNTFHPGRSALSGMLLCMRSIAERDRGLDRLIGVAQIGEYTHTTFPQRAIFGRRLCRGFDTLSRVDAIRAIPIAAGKRFAVHEDRRGEGLGEVLATQVLDVAANYRWPPARVVEVSRWIGQDEFYGICCAGQEDFLTRSGYVPVQPAMWMRRKVNATAPNALTVRRIPGYYYADVSQRSRPEIIREAQGCGC
jgi:hypothetical protein